MNDLISRQAAIEKRSPQERLIIAKTLIESVLDELPYAQSEIIRCKDCKYATYDKSIDSYNCRNWGIDADEYTEANDFCSYGERADT